MDNGDSTYLESREGVREVLRIENLHAYFYTQEGVLKAVNGVNLSVRDDSVLGIIGESGAGKSVTALSLLGLVPYPGKIVQGAAYFKGHDLLAMNHEQLRRLRGKDIAMIFQDPRGSLNPIETIGDQIEEILTVHGAESYVDTDELGEIQDVRISPRPVLSTKSYLQVRERAVELLREMDLPESVYKQYPYQISGGMAQRAMIAMVTAWQPSLLIADEPTSNLDMTIQADVLDRLRRLRAENQSSLILITHNMGIVAQMAQEVAVMYAGSVIEHTDTMSLFQRPYHPYTSALIQTIPRLDAPDRPLSPIAGTPPNTIDIPDLCPYIPRCPKATSECRLSPKPPLREIDPGHFVACYNVISYD
jgi:oligopeptide/dipeptide ABC transporter ATP-binding protein